MDDLAKEYWGRVRVARFMAMTRDLQVVSPELRDRYDLTYIPTVILFDRGVEVMRWRLVVMEDVYRLDLNKFLSTRSTTRPRPPAPTPTSVRPGR
jgi:hypothetical protein